MASNLNLILDPSAIISLLPTLLPTSSKRLESPQDAIAALFHTTMSAVGFRLIAVDESSLARTSPGGNLPEEWNKDGPSYYTFRYKHDQSSLEFVMKVSKLGGRTLINAIAVESDKAASLDISTNDFTSPSFYPYDLSTLNASPLVHGFISSNRVADLLSRFKLNIIQKLVPGLRKEGYSEDAADSSTNAGGSNPPAPRQQPVSSPYVPNVSPYHTTPYTPRNPLEIGRRDLDPIPQNPLEIGRRDLNSIPQNPFSPPPLFPGSDGDGMLVGPNHPIFGRGQGGRDPFGIRGPWGGDGYLPPMGAPPGARFDPVGPGPFPGPQPGRRLPRRGEEPDNDEFMPPGVDDMFM